MYMLPARPPVLYPGELSENFDWEEACITSHRDLDNTIPLELFDKVKNTAIGMERVRKILGVPIKISSWYRSEKLNIRVGSKSTSQHRKGEAVDWIAPRFGTPLQIVSHLYKVVGYVNFDQLILEYSWVHISFCDPTSVPRNQVLTLLNDKSFASGITDLNGKPYVRRN